MRQFVRDTILTVLRSRAWKATSQRIRGTRDFTLTAREYENSAAPGAKALVYFGDTHSKLYQLDQWLPVLEELNKTVPTAVLLRRPSAITETAEATTLPIVFRQSFDDMMTYVEEHQPKLILYVNNGQSNFQLLSYAPAVHVHINHGESDKLSMVSNQAKAYDAVFTAGPAALRRHQRALVDFDESKLIEVGRPQLDLDYEPELPTSDKRTVMYAPTWEGENDNNNYTSIDCFGPAIAAAALATPNTRLIYKPHPRVADSQDEGMRAGHAMILELIEKANAEGGEHLVLTEGNILAMFDDVDLMITDISSVGLDFLYLKADSPLLLTDRRTNRAKLVDESPIASSVPIIDDSTVNDIQTMIEAELTSGGNTEARAEARALYFGNHEVGESKQAFISTVERLIAEREAKHINRNYMVSAAEAKDGNP
ncbi:MULTISPECIES: CDP-glycerol glycerophosphotransferase family protein [Brevibacterium]|uniref:CDP-Glycerol:Poly(Glycerophosphate) glycerophosphotransferase n=1 Tax=Brevibacterium ravenspurgense TaxID=479117 RepID=A0A150HB67_9MICO|nr:MULTISPECIES: CDP-glycerol glycerophosphotransferase family protein [Brevibacterium]KXZ58900.1 CDP-Glycerol:Poly(glycerophosphate) glycerophosphotransferase [Brevibacterium ravenspurgense]MCG7301507.1 CDP-glycerol glycerophosphotransferase family protein [Brevibacterium ravenspurgense]